MGQYTPSDSIATIFIPEIDAGQIVRLAAARYANSTITQLDGQTIQLPVGGISYVPLPPGAAFGLTGLLSIELPDTVHKGEVYTILVRQVTEAGARRIPVPEVTGDQLRKNPRGARALAATQDAAQGAVSLIRWRQIVGSYRIHHPGSYQSGDAPA